MKFNKKKKDNKYEVLESINPKFLCEDVIELIKKDLGFKNIDNILFFCENEEKVVLLLRVLDKNQENFIKINGKDNLVDYKITITEPSYLNEDDSLLLYRRECIKVKVEKNNNHYYNYIIDVFNRNDNYCMNGNYKVNTQYINGDVMVFVNDNSIEYVIKKDNKLLEINVKNTSWRLDAILQKLEKLDLIELYNNIKSVDNSLVMDIAIKIKEDNVSWEELLIKNGILKHYNKKYFDGNILVSLDYKDGNLVKKTELVIDDINNSEIIDKDIENTIKKVKILK